MRAEWAEASFARRALFAVSAFWILVIGAVLGVLGTIQRAVLIVAERA